MSPPPEGTSGATRSRSDGPARLALLAVLCLFCVPLFVGLGDVDLRNDEAIYSYAADRMLETGDWLTPRSIRTDSPFLEKPPLKFWLVAGALGSGLLPHDEFGLRFLDAVFGAAAFVYVFVLGRWLAGPVCGFVAVLVLVTYDPLLNAHGLRENNMEAALVLAYCGGVYHFARWAEAGSTRRRANALAVAAYITLGFMTKFVAVLFLPLICLLALAWRTDTVPPIRSAWREWVVPGLLVVGASAPWFVYQAMQSGRVLWDTMIGVHVYARFTGALDAGHLQPWHFYFSRTWLTLVSAHTQWIAAGGILMLAAGAWTGRSWLTRVIVLWCVVPLVLMSMGTSKLLHYAYPFLPPVALGAGWLADWLFRLVRRPIEHGWRVVSARLVPPMREGPDRSLRRWPRARALGRPIWDVPVIRRLLLAGALIAFVVAVRTAVGGRILWEFEGVRLSNESVTRPAVIAVALFALGGGFRLLPGVLAMAVVAGVVPTTTYFRVLEGVTRVDRPLQSFRDCAVAVGDRGARIHLYPPYVPYVQHEWYYYLRAIGPWVEHDGSPKDDELQTRLLTPGHQTLVLLFRDDYERFSRQMGPGARIPTGLALADDIVLVAPGPFEGCAVEAIAATTRDIRARPVRETRP